MDVDRNCYYTIKQFDAVPFNFEEKVNVVRPPQKREDKCDPKKAKKNIWYLLIKNPSSLENSATGITIAYTLKFNLASIFAYKIQICFY